MKLLVKQKDPAELVFNEYNSRLHSEAQIEQIKRSIQEFGFTNPVLINSKSIVIAGHGRIQAATELGLESIPAITLDHLTEDQQRALVIADNQIAANSDWDRDILAREIEALNLTDYDTDLLGFDDNFIADLVDDLNVPDFKAGAASDQGQLDELDPVPVRCPECKHEFDSRKAKC